MANQKALVVDAGRVQQIPSADTLVVGTGIDAAAAGVLTIGGTTATSIVLGSATIPVSIPGDVNTVGGTQFTTDAQFDGNVTFGNASTDNISFVGQIDTAITQEGIAAPAVSPASTGRIYFDSTSNTFKVSQNGGAYVDLISGGTVTSVGASSPLSSSGGTTPTISFPSWPANASGALTNDGAGNLTWAPDAGGTVTSVTLAASTTGLTISGGASQTITTSGTFTLGGTLAVANGGTGTSTAFTQGSVVFAGPSGVYAQDNPNFFWDDTNNRLGVGTSAPAVDVDATKTVAPTTVLASGTATGGSSTTLVDSGASWTVNAFRGAFVTITAGTGAGQTRYISSNDPTTITIGNNGSNWITAPDATSVYSILAPGSVAAQAKNASSATGAQAVVSAAGNTANVSTDLIAFSSTNGGQAWGVTGTHTGQSTNNAAMVTTGTAAANMIIGPRASGAQLHIGTGLNNTTGGSRALVIDSNGTGAVTFNPDNSGNIDFAVRSQNALGMIYVAASTNQVGFNTTSPSYTVDVRGDVRFRNINNVSPSFLVQNNAGTNVVVVETKNPAATVTDSDRLQVYGGRVSIQEMAMPAGVPSAVGTAGQGKLFAANLTDNARPYWVDDTGLVLNMTMDRFVNLGTTAAVAVDADPKLPVFRSVALNGNATFTTSNLGDGRSVSVRVVCDASTRTLTWPAGWTWLGSGPPSSLAANDVGYLSITAYGATDADVVAAWSYENQPVAVTGSGVDNQIAVWSGTNTQDGSSALTFNGTTLGVTGGITQSGGAVSLTGNAASSLTTSSGALTLTSAAATTWSTTAGNLAVTAGANLELTAAAAGAVVVNEGSADVDFRVESNGLTHALFVDAGNDRIGVSASNLTHTFNVGDGINSNFCVASGGRIHTYDGSAPINGQVLIGDGGLGNFAKAQLTAGPGVNILNGAGSITISATGTVIYVSVNEAVNAGALVSYVYNGVASAARVQNTDANDNTAGTTRPIPVGFVTTAAAVAGTVVPMCLAGTVSVATTQFDVAPTTADIGKRIYMSETQGRVTLTAPSTPPLGGQTVAQKVGVLADVGGGFAIVLVQIGDPVIIQ